MMCKIVTLLVCAAAVVFAVDDSFNAREHNDWGSYYDPQNVFCGAFDCYKILGFNYEEFGRNVPDSKVITKRYRSLSRYWHPDKNKSKDAKDRFVKIARAYEVLTNKDTREEYDFLRYNQEAYYDKYGSGVLYKYAPKSDVLFVIFLILLLGSVLSWHLQKQQWQHVANRLIRAAIEDLPRSEGGTPESKQLREKAMAILAEREKEARGKENEKSKRKKGRLTQSEKREKLKNDLRPLVTEMVNDIKDFGAGYHQPTWRDLLVVRVAMAPKYLLDAAVWNATYVVRRVQGKPLNDDEKEVLTRRAVGEINWLGADEKEQQRMLTLELWIADNMAAWEEEKEMAMLSMTDRKRLKRESKKKNPDQEYGDDYQNYKYD